MDSSTQFVNLGRMEFYEPMTQVSSWSEIFRGNETVSPKSVIIAGNRIPSQSKIMENQSEDTSHVTLLHPNKYIREATKPPPEKVQRRLVQNREAARKCRLRKKAYVKQLESSRLKLIQLEQELHKARLQGLYKGNGAESNPLPFAGTMNQGIVTFELEYEHWLEEENRHISDLRIALNACASDAELRLLVESGMSHYLELFRLRDTASKADVLYVLSGIWKSPAERFLLWFGGSRPSELLKVIMPQLEPLTETQRVDVGHLEQSCQQAEDALWQGMARLQKNLAETVRAGHLGESDYLPQVETAMEKLQALARFVQLADHLRRVGLERMSQILTTQQAARGLLALGVYFERLRTLSSLWETHKCEQA